MLQELEALRPAVAVIDSIQTLYSDALTAAPGSVSQVRECAAQLTRVAKQTGVTIILVGHVTKDGSLAGPRTLEHLVDVVIALEGDRYGPLRLLRSAKNRFGSTNEIGVFEMRERGLVEVGNPSQLLLAERAPGVSGSAVVCTIDGHARALLSLEAAAQVQAAQEVVARKLSVRDTEKLVAKTLNNGRQAQLLRVKQEKSRDLVRLEEQLADVLAAAVDIRVHRKTKRGEQGEIAIAFGSLEELNGLLEKLGIEEE